MATIRLRNKTYRAEVYSRGIRRSASFLDLADAEKWVAEQEREIAPWRHASPRQPHEVTAERPEFQGKALDATDILALPRFMPACGVYFLIRANEIVYVGQSIDVHFRVQNHKRVCFKEFDCYTYIPCHEAQLLELERYYIKTLKPFYNVAGIPADIAA